MTDKVSVIIPAYNAKRFIGEAVESVFAQTHRNWEIIVVDDGSTDGTAEFVNARFPGTVRLIQQVNRGLGGARNAGIRVATGDYFQFLDADDLVLPRKFELQLDYGRRNPRFRIVYCDLLQFSDSEMPTHVPPAAAKPQGNLLEALAAQDFIGIHTVLFARDVVRTVGGFDEDRAIHGDEDAQYYLKCCCRGFEFGYLPEVLALYRRHAASMTAPGAIGWMERKAESCTRMLEVPLPPPVVKLLRRRLAQIYADLASAQARAGLWRESVLTLGACWQHRSAAARQAAGKRDRALWLVDVLQWLHAWAGR